MQKNNYIFNNLLHHVLEKLYNSHITILNSFLQKSESENNFLKIDETKKRCTAPIIAIIAMNSKSTFSMLGIM